MDITKELNKIVWYWRNEGPKKQARKEARLVKRYTKRILRALYKDQWAVEPIHNLQVRKVVALKFNHPSFEVREEDFLLSVRVLEDQ